MGCSSVWFTDRGDECYGGNRGGEVVGGERLPEPWVGLFAIDAALYEQGDKKTEQEGAREGRQPDLGEETVNGGGHQGEAGEQWRVQERGGGGWRGPARNLLPIVDEGTWKHSLGRERGCTKLP